MEDVDIAWIDEAQTITQKSLDDLIPTIRKDGSELWFSWNPHSPDDPVDKLLRSSEPPPFSKHLAKFYDEIAIVVEVNYHDNEWFSEILHAEMLRDKRRDPGRYAHIWCGAYRQHTEAAVFRNWRIGTMEEFAAYSPPGQREPRKKEISAYYFGADWGFSIDPSVLVRCFVDERTLWIDKEAYEIGCEIDHLPFLFGGVRDRELVEENKQAWNALTPMRRTWVGVPESRKWAIIADSSSPDIISFMQRHGFPHMVEAKKGAGSVDEGIEFLQSMDIVVHPACEHTIRELRMYSYKIDPKTDIVIPVLADKDNHVIDALRYACEGIRHPGYSLHSGWLD